MRRAFATLLTLVLVVGSAGAQHFDCLTWRDVGSSALVVVPPDVEVYHNSGMIPEPGDEIALVKDSTCVGSAVFADSTVSITVVGPNFVRSVLPDAPTGYAVGDTLRYVLWDASHGAERMIGTDAGYTCDVLSACVTDPVWTRDALYVLNRLGTPQPIPVELAAFRAEVMGDERVVFAWATLSETNSAAFVVERRAGDRWVRTVRKDGAGTTSERTTYSATANVKPGDHTFRLRQVDHDGRSEVVARTSVRVSMSERFRIEGPHPHPARRGTSIRMIVRKTQRVRVRLYDILGRAISTIHNERIKAYERRTIRVKEQPSGVYFLRVEGETFNAHRRVVFIR